ncbi:ABC transporter substrate-binding protein [Variovorax sp. PAMC28562]|uniref:extracellular solute-binding protein n=1 Tax=Variovorax sp. PAMC28562 TaxID=2762323 RepID=UPI00164EA037|nr:extracellular solute-binding protein [Variovorax sp. PAMC28562]QNK72866.1 ABC transporter substrate-binding protein [Variovorax sp. PAMC28562]
MIKKSILQAAAAIALVAAALQPVHAQDKTEITLARFFGACEADFGKSVDVRAARGECGVITTLVNKFNATNKDNIVVKPQIAEWGPYYDQLTSRIVARDVPTIAVMHQSSIGDYVNRKLIEPIDADLKTVGITPAEFTDTAKAGVTMNDKTYGLPFDTWSWLWHINTNLLKKAGLTNADGSVQIPKSPAELLAQARKYKQVTGKAYFAWPTSGSVPTNTWTFFSMMFQQNSSLFTEGAKPHINMHTPDVTAILDLMSTLYNEGLVVPGIDSGAVNQAWFKGDAAVALTGTWRIDDYMAASEKAESPAHNGYLVIPFPQLFAKRATFADGHAWVMLKGGAKDEKSKKAALTFLKFLWDNEFEWSRTGHLPANKKVYDSAEFKGLPMRDKIIEISTIGRGLAHNVPRAAAVQQALSEELITMQLSKKTVQQTEDAAETRVNKLLDSVR